MYKNIIQVLAVVIIASLLSLYVNKGSYFANNLILGTLTIVESQENMGDIYSQGLYGEKKDVGKAIEWYGDPLLYWENHRGTYSKKEIKIILNMFDKMATLLIHRSGENDINTVVMLYRPVAKSGHISKKGLKFLWDRRDEKKYSSLMQEEDFKRKLFLDANNSNWLNNFSHKFPSYDYGYDYGYDYSVQYSSPGSKAPKSSLAHVDEQRKEQISIYENTDFNGDPIGVTSKLNKICWDEGDRNYAGKIQYVCGTEEEKKKMDYKTTTIDRQRNEYVSLIAKHMKKNWAYKGGDSGWGCDVHILQNRDGKIKSVNIQLCDVSNKSKLKSFKESIEKAVIKSSPLPKVERDEVFEREILIKFRVD